MTRGADTKETSLRQIPPAVGTLPVTDAGHQTPDRGDTSWDLVQAAHRGDPSAFVTLYDRYVSLVYNYIYMRAGGTVAIAEALTRETFHQAMTSIRQFTSPNRDFGAWLVKIARKLFTARFRSARFRLDQLSTVPLDPPANADTAHRVRHVRQVAEDRELLLAVAKLSTDQQETIVLRFFQGMNPAQIADVMSKTVENVLGIERGAMRRLASMIAPRVGLDALGQHA